LAGEVPLPTVLIVDDHESIRRNLRLHLESSGFSVCGEAVNGFDAIEKAQSLNPELIILDLAMPEMNGLEAAAALKYIAPSVPLILLTAHASREVELAAYSAGICAVFSKYGELDALIDRAASAVKLGTGVEMGSGALARH
jgi:DNA-binding NarL/FixJ family response regulator